MARADADSDDICALGEDVDPRGHLLKLAGSSLVHTADNKVCYYERRKSGKEGEYM